MILKQNIRKYFFYLTGFALFSAPLIHLYLGIQGKTSIKSSLIHHSLYILLGMTGLIILCSFKALKADQIKLLNVYEFLRTHKKSVFASLIAAVFLFATAPPSLKGVNDSALPMSVSWSMYYNQNTWAIYRMDKDVTGRYRPLHKVQPKQALLFPFLNYLVHSVAGYNINHMYVVNFFVLWAFLFLLLFTLYRYLGSVWPICGILLLFCHPAFTHTMTSGGVQPLSILISAISLFALHIYLKNRTEEKLFFLVASLLLLSHCRQESFIISAFVLLYLIIFRKITITEVVKSKFFLFYASVPLFILPVVWGRIVRKATYSLSNAYFANTSISKVPGLEDNPFIDGALRFREMLNSDLSSPFVGWIHLIGILFVGYFVVSLFKRKDCRAFFRNNFHIISIALACLIGYWLIRTQFGKVLHPFTMRYYVIHSVVLTLLFLLALHKVFYRNRSSALVICAALFFLYYPQTTKGYHVISWESRQYEFVQDFLKEKNEKEFMLVADRSQIYAAEGYRVIDFKTAWWKRSSYLTYLKRKRYSNMYVLQHVDVDSEKFGYNSKMHPWFKLEKLAELQYRSRSKVRISRVTNYDHL